MKIGKWGEMSRGETSFGEKHRTYANFGKKWREMSFGVKRRRKKCHGEKCQVGRNVLHPKIRGPLKNLRGPLNKGPLR